MFMKILLEVGLVLLAVGAAGCVLIKIG